MEQDVSKKEVAVVPGEKPKRSFSFSRWFGQLFLWRKKNRLNQESERQFGVDVHDLTSSLDSLRYDDIHRSEPELSSVSLVAESTAVMEDDVSENKASASSSNAKEKQEKLLEEFALLSGIELSPQSVTDFRKRVEKQLKTKSLPPPSLALKPEDASCNRDIDSAKSSGTNSEFEESTMNVGAVNTTVSEDARKSESEDLMSEPLYSQEAIDSILSKLNKVNLINAIVVIGADGTILACNDHRKLKESTFEALIFDSAKHFQVLGQKSGFGSLAHSVIEFEEGKLIVENLGDNTLFIIVDGSAILGLIRKQTRAQIEKLKLILN